MNDSTTYIELRRLAWDARLNGLIDKALRYESHAERIGNEESFLEAYCDEMAANPGTTQADWAALMESV